MNSFLKIIFNIFISNYKEREKMNRSSQFSSLTNTFLFFTFNLSCQLLILNVCTWHQKLRFCVVRKDINEFIFIKLFTGIFCKYWGKYALKMILLSVCVTYNYI